MSSSPKRILLDGALQGKAPEVILGRYFHPGEPSESERCEKLLIVGMSGKLICAEEVKISSDILGNQMRSDAMPDVLCVPSLIDVRLYGTEHGGSVRKQQMAVAVEK